jgi:DNA mismatch endonuclease (patch repair protein)
MAAALRKAGLKGWRRHAAVSIADIAGAKSNVKPDFVFRKSRVVVFVHGCFWHGCPKHGSIPATNTGFWRRKIGRNKARDLYVSRLLRNVGWKVIRAWEHDTQLNVGRVVRRIRVAVHDLERPMSCGLRR